MINPLFSSIFIGLGEVYVLIPSVHDDDDDGEKYIHNHIILI